MFNNVTLIVKPTLDCNLKCKYCYAKESKYNYKGQRMSLDVVKKALDVFTKRFDVIDWIWHGGEPMLVSAEWYKKAYEIMLEYHNTSINISMQSNMTLYNQDWSDLMKICHIDIASSYDSDVECRVGLNPELFKANLIKYYEDTGEKVGVISVITEKNIYRLKEVYQDLKSMCLSGCKFNAVFENLSRENSSLISNINNYNKFINEFFEYYVFSDEATLMNSTIEYTMSYIAGGASKLCCNMDCLSKWYGIYPNGDIYICGTCIDRNYILGNIFEADSVEDFKVNGALEKVDSIMKDKYNKVCSKCEYYKYCVSGCPSRSLIAGYENNWVDIHECFEFKARFDALYRIIRKCDKNTKLGPAFKRYLERTGYLLPYEIMEVVFKIKNIGVDYKDVYIGEDNVPNLAEYKLYRLISEDYLRNRSDDKYMSIVRSIEKNISNVNALLQDMEVLRV